jgi:hypothetical protein
MHIGTNIMRGMSRTFSPRREFLRFLAASPLMARAWAQEATAGTLSNPKDALNVMDFESPAYVTENDSRTGESAFRALQPGSSSTTSNTSHHGSTTSEKKA